jgi:hypothetical protein
MTQRRPLTDRGESALPEEALTAGEEVTLRRVAYGQSELRALPRSDIAHLHDLGLIEEGRDGPQLTAAGRRLFEALPKAIIQTQGKRSFAKILAETTKTIAKRRR